MLYQKHRPKQLDEICGHTSVIKELKEREEKGNIPRSILINGVTGIGKTSIAYVLTKLISCSNVSHGKSCDKCYYCEDIIEERFHHVKMLNASFLDVESMRDLSEYTSTYSMNSLKKVIIIDELQELNSNKKAQKVLLKLLEEPYDHVHFILLSMDDSNIDKAIINRCVKYQLKPLEFDDIASHLNTICEKEYITIDEEKADVLLTIGENVNGSVREAVNVLERVIESKLWDQNKLSSVLGIVKDDQVSEILSKILNGDPSVFYDVKFSEEVLKKIKYLLSLLLKKSIGAPLKNEQKKQISGIAINGNEMEVYEILNQLYNFPYLNQDLIDFHIIKTIKFIEERKNK